VSDVAAEPILLIEDRGPVRRLTMNRPDALNALNAELTEAISVQIRAAGADDRVSVVIMRGAGRAFCAGYDLNEDATGGALDARHW
jgi:enoyl-CoA hydratase